MVLLFQLFILKAIFYVIFDQAEKKKKKKKERKKEIESGEIDCVRIGQGWEKPNPSGLHQWGEVANVAFLLKIIYFKFPSLIISFSQKIIKINK